ncbi:nucleoside hydrolase [Nocardia takedensis]|uniref:nucleoside hydrolase n=1 Tax=Nocardia takedensis TaxID=259390 RepID=UPI003F761EA9
MVTVRPHALLPAVICTDAGHDADDLLALILAVVTLRVRLVVTSDEFNDGERARLVRYLLDLCGMSGVGVIAGAELAGADTRWVCDGLVPDGYPKTPLLDVGIEQAVGALLDEATRVLWIGQGPLTNLARLHRAAPRLTRRMVIRQMGGGPARLYRRPERASHNLRMDTAAAVEILTASDLDLALVTSNITWSEEFAVGPDSAIYRMLAAENAPRWARLVAAGYQRWFQHRPNSKPADPLTVSAAAGMPFVDFAAQRMRIDPDARMYDDSEGVELMVSTSADYAGYEQWATRVVSDALDLGIGYHPVVLGAARGVSDAR